jgi:DNA polymerase
MVGLPGRGTPASALVPSAGNDAMTYPEITLAIRQRVFEYNRTDVEATIALDNALGRLPKRERRVWELDQQINQRGIAIDLDFVCAAKKIADQLFKRAIEEFRSLTGVNPTQVEKVRNWLADRGLPLENLEADTIEDALAGELSPTVRQVLKIRSLVAASSLKKFTAMQACVGSDGRARGLFQYHGATPGRWVGRIVQPQNFPRPTIEITDPEELVETVKTGNVEALRRWGEPVDVLVSSLRFAIVAQNDLFGCGDFAAIEARVLLSLAGQHDKVDLLADGHDIYRDMAAEIFGLDKAAFMALDDLTPEQAEQRQTGKNSVLGLGFGMGPTKFRDRYCAAQGEGFAQLAVNTYRNVWAPKVPQLWYDLERTAIRAMQNPGAIVTAACGVRYRLERKVDLPFLVCRLLNGKKIHYANAVLEMGESDWGKRPVITYWAIKDHHWRKVFAWHGHLTENISQALARELLVSAMFRFEARGFPVVMHCHDEIVVEHPDITIGAVEEIMSMRSQWAIDIGLPIAVEAWVGKRYRK